MGCGKQVSSRQSIDIVVISSAYERSQHLSVHIAAPISIKQELLSSDPPTDLLKPSNPERLSLPKESLVNISKISKREEDPLKHFTVRLRSPTEIALKAEEKSLDQGFNFDFLNESSAYNSNIQKIIDEVVNELKDSKDC